MDEFDFDYNDTAPAPLKQQEFLLENLCGSKGSKEGGYTPPATRSASKRWKRIHEQSMMLRLDEMHVIKKQNAQMSKEAARKIIRKIPVELLAKEWLTKEDATVDMRAYMVDFVLPTLILGVERLLKEVDEKGLSSTNRFEPEFNPLNFLAQYLMRNNPRYSNFAEASPYVRGLREVSEELKQELFTFEDNRLARIKAEARRKRTEREKVEQMLRQERERRQAQLVTQFHEWNVPTDNNRVELSLLQNALRSFAEIAEQLPEEVREVAKFGHPLEPTDETGRTLAVKEFAQYISLFVEDLPIEVFEQFMTHMSKCAAAHRASAERENRRIILTNLFLLCDHGGLEKRMKVIIKYAEFQLGLLDRHRILTLFEQYWDMLRDSKDPKGTLRNPRRWPVVEVDEVDDTLFDGWEEDDGGLMDSEIPVSRVQFMNIKKDLVRTATQNAVTDQAAREQWKMEQLSEKSEGMRKKLYEWGVTDFMALPNYRYTDTVECSPQDMKLKINKITGPHDLFPITATASKSDRQKFVCRKRISLLKRLEKINSTKPNLDKSTNALDDEDGGKVKVIDRPSEAQVKGRIGLKRRACDKSPQDASTFTPAENEWQFPSYFDKLPDIRSRSNSSDSEHSCKKDFRAGCRRLTSQRVFISQGSSASFTERNDNSPHNRPRRSGGKYSRNVDITGEMAGGSQPKSAMKPPEPGTQPTATGRVSVTFAGNTAFDREKTASLIRWLSLPCEKFASHLWKNANDNKMMRSCGDENENSCYRVRNAQRLTMQSRSQSQMSAFDESVLNVSQFVQLTETYLGHHPDEKTFEKLVVYMKEGYEETEEEKMERLVKARKEAISAKRKLMMDNLFEKWDNDGSGFLEMEDVQEVMAKYKDGQEMDAIKRAQQALKKKSKYHDTRLSRREFRQYIELIVDELPGAESFEFFVEFLTNSVERSCAERIRGEARKKWLSQIVSTSQTSGTSLDPVYKAVFQALYKDAEAHGGEKSISASVSMLEHNHIEPGRGDLLLRYAACTPEDCQYMLGKALFHNQKGISFQAVEGGKPVHVPRVANHGNIYFWNFDRMPEDREGSFIVVPLKDKKKRVFGVLGIDTLCDSHKKAIFITHEIQYFQGVAKCFSIAYHNVDVRRKLLRITESAISWIQRRCPHISEITVYVVEPSTKAGGEAVLRKMISTDQKGQAVQITEVVRLERKDNLFRDYLFKCMDNSETVTADAYGKRHTASPLRDNDGKALGVVDISIGDMKKLPPYENKEAQRMLRLLQQAHREITKEAEGDETTRVLDAEKDDEGRMDIMFDRLMLMELRENVSRLDPQSFAELKSYNEPPPVIHDILRATLALFYLDRAGMGGFDDWSTVKNYINNDLIQQIKSYDPTVATELVETEKVEKYLKDVPHGEVAKYGSIPAQQLYNWVFVCISLIEHTRKMRENAEGNVMVAAGDDEQTPTTERKDGALADAAVPPVEQETA
ncbi:EF-hand calcium-binding domain-containing protein 5 [Aplysia californica]|uniref:EF-hand calcium-binding domain-containing protein 5 n=1 Tax=Aplysia californica TaxID=6500 RepID=A0ABM1VX13_APLCA|nr:EF-hand calcium-binding domain-containing protein 5 [Aplysia californica]